MERLQRRTDPSFCFITPTDINYLSVFATQSTTHLVLAHIVETNDAYASFYKRQAELGDFVIMDNGAFELGESYNPNKLISLGQKCGAHALVLPDYPFREAHVTIEAGTRWAKAVREAGFYTFFAPQSKTGDLDDWVHGYEWAAENDDIDIIGMSILGIPNAIPHVPKAYARVVMTELLQRQNRFAFHKYHHYLGLNAGPNVEIPALLKMNALDTVDSSNPVWCGINGLQYAPTQSDWMPMQKRYLREVDFDQEWTKKDHIRSAIQHNIEYTLDLFADPDFYLV